MIPVLIQPSARPGTLFFFSNSIPEEGIGSFIVFKRHLLPLVEKGWKLNIFSYFPPPASNVWWNHIRLPHRLAWWPPTSLRIPWSVDIQTELMLLHLKNAGHLHVPDGPRILLGTFWDHQTLLAAKLAQRDWAPLGIFLHDDEIRWDAGRAHTPYLGWRRKRLAKAAHRIWSVSERLTNQLPSAARAKTRLLRPIPGTNHSHSPRWNPSYAQSIHLGYAGKVYPGLEKLIGLLAGQLAPKGGRMTIITDPETSSTPPVKAANLDWLPYFETADNAMSWLQNNCSALLVAHPLKGDSPPGAWNALENSFPSKLVEYSRLGLPIILAGNPDSELGDWARLHPGIPFLGNHSLAGFAEACDSWVRRDSWLEAARVIHRLSETEHHHNTIQNAFLGDIGQMVPAIHEPPESRN